MRRYLIALGVFATLAASACSKKDAAPAAPAASLQPTPAPGTAPDDGTNAREPHLAPADVGFNDARYGWGWGDRCVAHLKAGKVGWALAACDQGLALTNLDPKARPALLYNRGLIAKKAGDTAAAKAFFEQSIKLRPEGDPGKAIVEREYASLQSPSPSPSASAQAGNDGSSAQAAERCLADPTCPFERGMSLFAEAERTGSGEPACWRFVEGVGAPKDLNLARTCLIRILSAHRPDTALANLDSLVLATLMQDGRGGPVDEAAEWVERGGGTDALARFRSEQAKVGRGELALLDMCNSHARVNWDFEECSERDRARSRFIVYAAERKALAATDPSTAAMAIAAREAWDKLSDKLASWSADTYRGGSALTGQYNGVLTKLARERATSLAGLDTYQPASADVGKETTLLDAAVAAAKTGDAQHNALLAAAQAAWPSYRAKERELYLHVISKRVHRPDVEQGLDGDLVRAERVRIDSIRKMTAAPPRR
jgi:uncharacterized protein YecT (DUF1311 family)